MRPFRDETELATALRELRPAPERDFAAELDAWAAAGFPRRSSRTRLFARLRERLAATPPRRILAPAGAFAVVAVVVATAVVGITSSGGPTATDGGGGNTLGYLNEFDEPYSGSVEVQPAAPQSSKAGGENWAGVQFAPSQADGAAVAGTSAPSNSGPDSGPFASQAGRREIERSADMVLATDPDQIRAATSKVFDAVHASDGIVLSSSIRDGDAGVAVAGFELLIPSDNLGDALASFSRIAEVRSRQEATQDITAPIVGVGERLQDARATVQSLLGQLADADTEEERVVVESQLRNERFRVAALRSRLSSLERRANFSRVSLRIETGAASSSSSDEGGSAGWGVGDGIDGAGRILAVAAGVTVIGLAILAPFALIALLAWLTRRAYLRRARRSALART